MAIRTSIASALLLASGGAFAQATLPPPTASYTADLVIQSDQGHTTVPIQSDHGRQLVTADTAMGRQTFLIRPDQGRAYMLQPGLGTALAIAIDKAAATGLDLSAIYRMPAEPVGRERVAGLATTKYRTAGSLPSLGSFTGFVWATDDGIIARVEGTASRQGRQTPVHAELQNLHVGPQDPSRFELPAGMRVVNADPLVQGLLQQH